MIDRICMQRILFVSFAAPTESWHALVNQLCQSVKANCPNIETIAYTEKDLQKDEEFWNKHGEFVENNKRGYGYWIWKSYLINKTLKDINDNDIIIYADGGCFFNPCGLKRLNEYIQIVNDNYFGMIVFQLEQMEIKWTKYELLEYMNVSEEDKWTRHIMATSFIVKKTQHSSALIKQWFETCSKHELINDDYQKKYDEFIDHRHDQSVLSLLVKKQMKKDVSPCVIKDETYFEPNWYKDGKDFPIWAVRNRG